MPVQVVLGQVEPDGHGGTDSTLMGSNSAARWRTASVGSSSTTTTSAARWRSWRTTASPLTPRPTTRARSATGDEVVAGSGEEVGVEGAHGEGRAQTGEDPEAHDHRCLRPSQELEVVMDGRHAEHPPVEVAEGGHLDHHRHGHDDEHAAD